MKGALINLFVFLSLCCYGQRKEYKVYGKILAENTKTPVEATVFVQSNNIRTTSDETGSYLLLLPEGEYKVEVTGMEMQSQSKLINLTKDTKLDFFLFPFSADLEEVEVTGERLSTNGIARLGAVDGFGIYEAKKNELIILDDFAANKVSNNARQVFAKVPGLNIWESDFAGLQLDIAARGLGPSRTANFNTRQNGYDMSADALGYPESYYMPSMQAVERIEIVRGAASLQYGTQFGGMLNFKLKEASKEPVRVNIEQAVGSFGLLNSYADISGTLGKVNYFTYYQYRQGDGWRENSGFDSHLAFGRLGYAPNERLKLGIEYSFLDYQAQQPGGLTDEDFETGNLEQSRRNRNWFRVNWNLISATFDYEFTKQSKLNVRSFSLLSGRDALGNLDQINRLDDTTQNRTLIRDEFQNFGVEARWLNYFDFLGGKSALLIGSRYYDGLTDRKQGDANASSAPDFFFLNPENLEEFDFEFPSKNIALFAEAVVNVNKQLSFTPGLRFEHIRTDAVGTWKQTIRDFAGNIETQNVFYDDESVVRSFVLFGLGTSYYFKEDLNIYANFSENFRSVTFSDLRLNNPNFVLDSLITDESGFNMDLGIRGKLLEWLNADISLFFLKYNDRIGVLLPPGTTTLLRTNVGDSRHYGLESFMEINAFKLLGLPEKKTTLTIFSNFSWINARYTASDDPAIEGNQVEYVPGILLRTGLNFNWKNVKATYQYSYLGEQFSDATNSIFNPNSLTGLVPSYHVMDFSMEYKISRFKFSAGVNNLTDQQYFTRRAESYPGPGIIPATPRSYYFAFGISF